MGFITITGGGFSNKGSQSMVFITIDEIKKRFPDKEVIFLSARDSKLPIEEKKQYTFRIMSDSLFSRMFLAGGIYKLIAKTKSLSKTEIDQLDKILKNTEMSVDISGYALGSNWKFTNSLSYLMRIITAKKYGITTFIMPQSFGPFNYRGIHKLIMNFLIKKYMKYPKIICAREMESFKLLTQKYNLQNVIFSYDMVLQNKEINIKNIFTTPPIFKKLNFFEQNKNIAIIPSIRNFQYGNKEKIIKVYISIIDYLIYNNKIIYIIPHSLEDKAICKDLKEKFLNNKSVILLLKDFSCLEFEQLVNNFSFLIASRYHSIVHAYKKGVPCIVLGWANKYNELLKHFGQSRYIFDISKKLDKKIIIEAVSDMLKNQNIESITIKNTLKDIQKNNVFNYMEIDNEKNC